LCISFCLAFFFFFYELEHSNLLTNAFQEFEGRTLKMNYAKAKKKKPSPPPPPKPGPTFNLFVANLPFEAKSKDLKEFFIAEGANVVSAEIIFHDNPRRPSGYGFVAFKTKKEADYAISTFSEKVILDSNYVTLLLS